MIVMTDLLAMLKNPRVQIFGKLSAVHFAQWRSVVNRIIETMETSAQVQTKLSLHEHHLSETWPDGAALEGEPCSTIKALL